MDLPPFDNKIQFNCMNQVCNSSTDQYSFPCRWVSNMALQILNLFGYICIYIDIQINKFVRMFRRP